MVLAVNPLHGAEPIGIELVQGGKRQQLSDEARSQIADRLPKLFATCSLNSRDHPKIFGSGSVAAMWEDTSAKDHVLGRLAAPIELKAGHSPAIPVEQLLIGLHDPKFPGPYLSRQGGQVTAYAKCSGIDIIRFVCAPGVKAAMPASYHKLCLSLVEIERSGIR